MIYTKILQDSHGEIFELNDKKIENFFCIQVLDSVTKELKPCLFWLKVCELDSWNRFFVDEFLCSWDIYEELDLDDFNDEDFPYFDFCQKYDLNQDVIKSIKVKEIKIENCYFINLTIEFENCNIIIENDSNGNSILFKKIK